MSRFIDFIRRERLYLLVLIFVAIVTAMIIFPPDGGVKHTQIKASRAVNAAAAQAVTNSDRERVEKVFTQNRYLAIIFGMVTLLVIAVFLLGLIIDAIFAVTLFTGKKSDLRTYAPQKISWGLWDVARVAILFVFFGYNLLIIEALLVKYLPFVNNDNIRMIINTSIMDVICVLLILHFTVGRYHDKLEALGLSLKNFFKNVRYGLLGYVALVPLLIGIIAVIAYILSLTKYVPEQQPVVQLFFKEKSTTLLLYTSLFAAIAGPVIEELFFRGFMYNAVKKRIGVFWAALITAAFFAMLHAHAVGFFPILAIGLLLAYLYEKTGTLVASITVHVMHNLSMVALVFLVKQLGVY